MHKAEKENKAKETQVIISQGTYSERLLREISFLGFLRPAQPQIYTILQVHKRSCTSAPALFIGFLEQLQSKCILQVSLGIAAFTS